MRDMDANDRRENLERVAENQRREQLRAASEPLLQLAENIVRELAGPEPDGNADCWWSMVRRTEKILRADRAASASVPAYRIRELESALQQIKDTTEGSRCVDCEAVHVVASDAMSYVPARAAVGNEPDIFVDALASQLDAIRRAAFDECIVIAKDYDGLSAAEWVDKYDGADRIADALVAARDITPAEGERK